MNNVDVSYRLKELSGEIKKLAKELIDWKENADLNEMWDNSEMIRKWKLSTRTLASWRTNGLIQFVQVGGKIYYTKEMRDEFLRKNTVNDGGRG